MSKFLNRKNGDVRNINYLLCGCVTFDAEKEKIEGNKKKYGVEPICLMEPKVMMERNPMEGKKVIFVHDDNNEVNADGIRGHLEVIGDSEYKPGFYEKYIKRLLDIVLSLVGLVVLSPFFLIIIIVMEIDDPGPIIFSQKRVGKNKKYFKLHKFRSMKMSTPHDVPTHMLENPEQYITRIGSFMRRHSIDELVQCFNILGGSLSVIGPRPALWNQDLLTAERDKYGANDIKPGLTGWAQINGRDELDIPVKAKLDGEYTARLKQGGWTAFAFDCKCFFGTVFSVIKGDGVVEGGTGARHTSPINPNDSKIMYTDDEHHPRSKK